MSITIIDGAKLRKINTIEKFLERTEKQRQQNTSFFNQYPEFSKFTQEQKVSIKPVDPKATPIVYNNPNTFSILKKELLENPIPINYLSINEKTKEIKEGFTTMQNIVKQNEQKK